MSFLLTRCLKRSHVVEELYENWQLAHKEAMLACDVEELCGEALDLCQLLRRAWGSLVKDLFAGPVFNTETAGRLFQDAVRRSIRVVRRIVHLVEEAERRKYTFQGASQLSAEMKEIVSIERSIERKWPFADAALIDESRSAYRRGEYRLAEEILHEAKNDCAKADK